ncbi:MAG: hypothetical protein ACK518_01360 [bacterium]
MQNPIDVSLEEMFVEPGNIIVHEIYVPIPADDCAPVRNVLCKTEIYAITKCLKSKNDFILMTVPKPSMESPASRSEPWTSPSALLPPRKKGITISSLAFRATAVRDAV